MIAVNNNNELASLVRDFSTIALAFTETVKNNAKIRPLYEKKDMPYFDYMAKNYTIQNRQVYGRIEPWIKIVRPWIQGAEVVESEKISGIISLCLGKVQTYVMRYWRDDEKRKFATAK